MKKFIKKESIDRIYEDSDLIKVIKTKVELKKQGANYAGPSPFSEEKTPSFMVSPAKGIWKDFSTGKGGNNAVSFIMEFGYDWIDALKLVAEICGLTHIIEYEDSKAAEAYQQKTAEKESLSRLMQAVVRKYQEQLINLENDHPAKKELQKRGYSQEIIEKYQIGYAPGGHFIYDLCKEYGLVAEAREIGLISEQKNYDFWVDRVVYPFLTSKKRTPIVGMSGRRLNEDTKFPKWMNPKQSKLYDKSSFWYGLNFAVNEIVSKDESWIVEGYNDVIAWQTNGLSNTIASSGTAVSDKQIKMLKRYTKSVILCFDGDNAGIKSMLKHIAQFMRNDFRVFVKILPDGMDPDEFVKTKDFDKKAFVKEFSKSKNRTDGFKFLMEHTFKGKDEVGISQEAKSLFNIICNVKDEAMQEIYTNWLSKESKVSKSTLNKWKKELETKVSASQFENTMYLLPKGVTTPLDKLIDAIEKYQMFQSDSKVWVMNKADEPPYTFKVVTNFEIKIIQHMQDEKFPKKLIWMKNQYGKEVIFDCLSSDVNTPLSFENLVTNQGKFYWTGNRNDHQKLKIYLFESMGTGRMIEVLGWQPEGFWVWNNKVHIPEENKEALKTINIDENGVFKYDKTSYYVPSANKVYARNMYKFEAQKKLYCHDTKNTFTGYTSQMMKVHREHAIMGILFTLSSMFQDVVVNELGFFPMLFLYGPASSGKDQLAECCQSFFGKPQTAINLEGGVSTIKAQVREFAQFSNIISHLSEYKNGDPKLDGVLKGLWDRRGYKRGNIDSHVGTDSIPILSSVLLTGNYAPDQDALITRLIWNFMDKTVFSDEEVKEYEVLADMTKKGISGLTELFLQHRETVIEQFKSKHREFKATLSQRSIDANSRMLSNLAVFGAFYQIFNDIVSFPFTMQKMLNHFQYTLEKQMNKLNSASIIAKFWECFLACMRMGQKNDQIRVNRDFKVEGDKMYFNFTNCYNRIQRQWYSQYHDMAPGKSTMSTQIKKDNSFFGKTKSTRMTYKGKEKVTSAYIVKLSDISIGQEILNNVEFQLDEDGQDEFERLRAENERKNLEKSLKPSKIDENNEKTDELPF